MAVALAQNPRTQSLNKATVSFATNTREFVVFCPGCKTLETVWFNDGRLMQTRKFHQQDKQVFHDCGTSEPCRLYHSW